MKIMGEVWNWRREVGREVLSSLFYDCYLLTARLGEKCVQDCVE